MPGPGQTGSRLKATLGGHEGAAQMNISVFVGMSVDGYIAQPGGELDFLDSVHSAGGPGSPPHHHKCPGTRR